MSSVQILAFPVKIPRTPFVISDSEYPMPSCKPDWSRNNPVALSAALNCQVKINAAQLSQLKQRCQLQTDPLCLKFLEIVDSYEDVLERDDEALSQMDFNVRTYVVVIVYQDVYFGHIYAWINPQYPNYCMAMGIRNRVDSIFLKDRLRNISTYLLEGVRRLAVALNCDRIIITNPMLTMGIIAENLGFVPTTVPADVIGVSVGYEFMRMTPVCYNCLEYNRLNEFFITEPPIQFKLVARRF